MIIDLVTTKDKLFLYRQNWMLVFRLLLYKLAQTSKKDLDLFKTCNWEWWKVIWGLKKVSEELEKNNR